MAQPSGGVAQMKWMVPILAGIVSACGSGTQPDEAGPDEEPCWGLVEPMPDPKSHAEHTCNAILEHRTRELEETFGPYARGETPVYMGTVAATDSLGGELRGSAYARIVREDYVGIEVQGPGAVLQVVVPGSDQWVTVAQADAAPETLLVGVVLPRDNCCGSSPTSSGALRLGDPPDTLELDLHAVGASPSGREATVSVELHLEKLAQSELDVRVLLEFPSTVPVDYAVIGDELWRKHNHETGIGYDAETPSDYTGTGTCGYAPDYSIEQFVKLDDLSTYGVREAVLHDNEIYCGSCQSDFCRWDYEKHIGAK